MWPERGRFIWVAAKASSLIAMDGRQYGGQWIAILNSEVVLHGKDIARCTGATKIAKDKTPPFVEIPDKNKERTLIL